MYTIIPITWGGVVLNSYKSVHTRGYKALPVRNLRNRELTEVHLSKRRPRYTHGLLDMLREYSTHCMYSYTFPVDRVSGYVHYTKQITHHKY